MSGIPRRGMELEFNRPYKSRAILSRNRISDLIENSSDLHI